MPRRLAQILVFLGLLALAVSPPGRKRSTTSSSAAKSSSRA